MKSTPTIVNLMVLILTFLSTYKLNAQVNLTAESGLAINGYNDVAYPNANSNRRTRFSLTDDFGAPLYVYDAEKIHQQFQTLNQAFDGVKLKIKYACKSLTNISILKLLKQYGSELDCVSIQEVYLGLRAGYKPKEEKIYTNFGEIA